MCRSLARARVGDLGSKLGSLSSTCSSSTCSLEGDLGEASKILGDWTDKSIEGLGATIEEICGSCGKIFMTEEVDREAWK